MTSGVVEDLVVVTGASRGIGRAIAIDQGRTSHVLCVSRSEKAISTAAEICAMGGSAFALTADLGMPDETEIRVQHWLQDKSFRRIDAVLAAGVLGPRGPLERTEFAAWEQTFRTNVLGNLAVAKAVIRHQRVAGRGRLLFFAGGGAAYAYPKYPAYAASKAALVRVVEDLHEDMKSKGDFSTAILAPGAIETDMLAEVRASGAEIRTTIGVEEPVAFVRAFLAAEKCGFSGRFVHVRDVWAKYLNSDVPIAENLWKLRRVE